MFSGILSDILDCITPHNPLKREKKCDLNGRIRIMKDYNKVR